ncbi:MAG: hypothetical protein O7I93_13700 [Gemmatimonadetes bacterium]|nr:hypothetical protein [Gemmatimonadota bacterium]
MRTLLIIVLTLTICSGMAAQERFASTWGSGDAPVSRGTLRLIIAPHVFDELDRLSDTLQVETVRCLIGTVSGMTAMIDLAYEPPVTFSSATRVSYQSCPRATIILWHNHPKFDGVDAEYACYMSSTDIREGSDRRAPALQMVQVNRDVACWWLKRQVTQAAGQPLLWPLESQRRGGHVTLADACARWGESPPCTVVRNVIASRR